MRTDAARVRRLREQRAWSQEQLAEIAGINVRTLQRVESTGGGSLETRMALAAALEVTPAELCVPPDPPPESPAGDAGQPAPPVRPDPKLDEVRVLLWAVFVSLMLILGYLFGRDMARKHSQQEQARESAAQVATPATPGTVAARQPDDSTLSRNDSSD